MNRRKVVATLAALGTAIAVWLVVFGMPGSKFDYTAFAHHYDYNNDTVVDGLDFHVEVDKVMDGSTFCEPADAAGSAVVGGTEDVAVCITDAPAAVGAFSFDLSYDDTLNECVTPTNDDTGSALDDNPDANAGATTWPHSVTGDDLGGGWDASGFGLAYPTCAGGTASIGALSLTGPFTLGDNEAEGVLAVVHFNVIAAGVDALALANVVIGDSTGAEIGSCNPSVAVPIPCVGGTDIKDFPPDIEVTKVCDDQLLVGESGSCDITVHNAGLGTALNVDFLDGEVGGPSLDYTGYTILPADPGCIFVAGLGGGLSCPLGPMAPSDAFDITIDFDAAGPAESFNENCADAQVTLGNDDEDTGNNTACDTVHEFLPDINAEKRDVTPGLPGALADGWTINLYSGACPPAGGAIDTGVTASGVVAFDDLAVGTYCVEEVLLDPVVWERVDCADGVIPEATLTEELTLDGSAKDFDANFCNKRKDVRMEKDPDLANLWICEDVHPGEDDCDETLGEGALVIDEEVSNVSGDPDGVGAYEFQVKFDHKVFDITVEDTSWLSHGGTRLVDCTNTIINENSILFGCVSKDPDWQTDPGTPPPGQDEDGVAAQLTVLPEPDMKYRLTPGQQNGVVRVILDENCELADIYGDPLQSDSTDQDGDTVKDEDPIDGIDNDGDTTIDEDWVDESLLPGLVTGGLVEICTDATITVRILEGDLNTDCEVDVIDDQMIAFRYGAFFGNLLYDPWFDLEPALKDFDVDIKDLQKVFGRNGSTCQNPIPPQDPLNSPPPVP